MLCNIIYYVISYIMLYVLRNTYVICLHTKNEMTSKLYYSIYILTSAINDIYLTPKFYVIKHCNSFVCNEYISAPTQYGNLVFEIVLKSSCMIVDFFYFSCFYYSVHLKPSIIFNLAFMVVFMVSIMVSFIVVSSLVDHLTMIFL